MRPDMAKVIVERPRVNSRCNHTAKGSKRAQQRVDDEDQPQREKIKRKWEQNWSDEKRLNEHLNPLYRWLIKQVGRPWNKVYSEMTEHIRLDSAVQSHVLDHANDYVEKNVIIIDGKPRYGTPPAYGSPLEGFRDILWVHPVTGILRLLKATKKWSDFTRRRKPDIHWIDDTHQAHEIDDIWYSVGIKKIKPVYRDHTYKIGNTTIRTRRFVTYRDIAAGYIGSEFDIKNFYGDFYRGVSKRQLNKQEIKKLELRRGESKITNKV